MPSSSRSRAQVRTATAFFAVVSLAVIAISMTGCSDSKGSAATSEPAVLYVFGGSDAELQPIANQNGQVAFALRLNCSDLQTCPQVTWFTDRPDRDSGTLPIAQFAQLWSSKSTNSFQSDPPNVAIEVPPSTTSDATTLVATMADVTLARSVDGSNAIALLATLTPLSSSGIEALTKTGSHVASHATTASEIVRSLPVKLGTVSVFVDDGSLPPQPAPPSPLAPPSNSSTQPGSSCVSRVCLVYSSTFIPFDSSF